MQYKYFRQLSWFCVCWVPITALSCELQLWAIVSCEWLIQNNKVLISDNQLLFLKKERSSIVPFILFPLCLAFMKQSPLVLYKMSFQGPLKTNNQRLGTYCFLGRFVEQRHTIILQNSPSHRSPWRKGFSNKTMSTKQMLCWPPSRSPLADLGDRA